MSQSISRRSFLKCAGSGAVSLAAALLTGVCAAAQQPCLAGEPALLDGKAAVELLGYAPAPELGGVLVYLSVENLSAASLPVDTSYLQSRGLRTREQLYSMGTGVTAACNGQSVPCGSFAAPLYSENAADASVFTLNLAAGRGALLHCFCAVPEDWQTLELTYQPAFAASQPMTARISHTYDELWPEGAPHVLTHFGGEFVAGSTARLQDFMAECRNVFDRMQQTGVRSQDGDEAILDAAAYRSQLAGKPVRAANAYVFRYWLGGHFYYVSTNYCCDPVCVLHLPGKAKMRQLTVLYHKYSRSGRMPENQTVWRLCCLPAARPPLLRSLWVRLRAKIGI